MNLHHGGWTRGVTSRSPIVRVIVLSILILNIMATDARAGNVSWVNDADSYWTLASNWSSNPALPGPNDDVTLNVPGDRLIGINGTQSIKSLVSAERITMSDPSAVLNLAGTARFDNSATFAGIIHGGTLTTGPGGALKSTGALLDHVTLNAPVDVTDLKA